ncbi:MAG: hypothetical protein ACK48S_09785 [Planctomycetia bacterium]|jgi:hypothetical protein
MITTNIDVKKIDKSALYAGAKGTYLNLTLIPNKNGVDQYGNDGFIVQDIGKARRDKGEKGPIIGNYRILDGKQESAPKTTTDDDFDDVPF